jgi:hypothetical protein
MRALRVVAAAALVCACLAVTTIPLKRRVKTAEQIRRMFEWRGACCASVGARVRTPHWRVAIAAAQPAGRPREDGSLPIIPQKNMQDSEYYGPITIGARPAAKRLPRVTAPARHAAADLHCHLRHGVIGPLGALGRLQ